MVEETMEAFLTTHTRSSRLLFGIPNIRWEENIQPGVKKESEFG
jgi:hypothetical protein